MEIQLLAVIDGAGSSYALSSLQDSNHAREARRCNIRASMNCNAQEQ